MRVIVIGGGIGGLTAAIALAKVGIDAHVYERAPELREVGAGIGLAGNALRALDALGLGSELRAQSLPGVQGGLTTPNGRVLIAIPGDDMTRQLGTVAVFHRAELQSLLLGKVHPDRLHLGSECVGSDQDGNGVTARFTNGETVRGDILIAADGLRSAVREQLFGHLPVLYSGYTAWRCVIDAGDLPQPSIGEAWGPGRRFGIVPMSRGRVYWFATNNTPEGERDPPGQSKQVLSNLFRGWHAPIEALIGAAREESILRNDIYDMEPLSHWTEGRVALLGDAAHPMTPNLGQGACQAIEDAVVLAACLKTSLKSSASAELALLEYQRRRIPRARQFVLNSRRLGTLGQLENPLLCWVRNLAMLATPARLAASQMKSAQSFEILTAAEKTLFTNP